MMICALSGEATSNAVVTPSGYVCDYKLLLSKLADNGGVDPFSNEPLDDEAQGQLIHLKNPNAASDVMPPRPSATSMPSLLQLLHSEYSNLMLELFDTRKLLESTRKELSQALYQNDAAVRVIARLSMERDTARQELLQQQQQQQVTTATATTTNGGGTPAADNDDDGPTKKRARSGNNNDSDDTAAAAATDASITTTTIMPNRIPVTDLDSMIAVWQTLSQQRKANKKATNATAAAMTPTDIANYTEIMKKSYHKSSGKQGIVAMAMTTMTTMTTTAAKDDTSTTTSTTPTTLIVTAGKDKQVCVYNGSQVIHSYTVPANIKYVDAVGDMVVVATEDHRVICYQRGDADELMAFKIGDDGADDDTSILGLSLHPSQKHIVVLTQTRIYLYAIATGKPLTYFQSITSKNNDTNTDTITCGALHPDGLIYAVGTANGKLQLWDFKSQTLASTLVHTDGTKDATTMTDTDADTAAGALTSIVFSNNGYHVATITNNTETNKSFVTVWDLKKQAVLKVLSSNQDDDDHDKADTTSMMISAVTFDPMGKYLAHGDGQQGIVITQVKEWKPIVTISLSTWSKGKSNNATHLLWGITTTTNTTNSSSSSSSAKEEEQTQTQPILIATKNTDRTVRFYGTSSSL